MQRRHWMKDHILPRAQTSTSKLGGDGRENIKGRHHDIATEYDAVRSISQRAPP